MAATKRNAGLTSAVPRATLNDEELVCIIRSKSEQPKKQIFTNAHGFGAHGVKYCVVDNNANQLSIIVSTCEIEIVSQTLFNF